MRELLATMVEIHDGLAAAKIPHAFGGALALMWCTGEPRTTKDIDLNIFATITELDAVLRSLPSGIVASEQDREVLTREGQRRLYYDDLPIDLFFNTTDFHENLVVHSTTHEIAGRHLPFLSCNDLGVFKAFFNRRQDWADIEEMMKTSRIDVAYVLGILVANLGTDDQRVLELLKIRDEMIRPN